MAENMKIGAMISAANMKKMQAAHDALKELGVQCGEMGEESKSLPAAKMMKMMEMGAVDYAIHEGWDIQMCCSVISQLSQMCQDECREGEMDEAMTLCNIMMQLMDHCKGECQEMMDSINKGKSEGYVSKSFATPIDHKLDLSYVKSLNVNIPENKIAVKYVGKNTIAHPVFIWGDAKKTDLEIEFFTKSSDFWDESLKDFQRPLTWDHGQDEKFNSFEDNPVIGKTVKFYDDDIARWAESVIETDKKYRKYIDQFIEEKRLGYSSDSAPQYVIREPQGKATWLKMWPWFGGALTASPCEPRMKVYTPEFLKSLGVQLPDVNDSRLRYEHKKRQAEYLKLKGVG